MSETPRKLFAPPDNRDDYVTGDFARVASQQPLKYNELPWYLYEEVHPLVRPPKLWCGWRVDEEDLLRLAHAKCPEVIHYTGMGHPDPLEMLMSNDLPRKICELCQIPEEDWDLVQTGMVFVAKTNGVHDPDIVITCGSTTNGVVGDAERARMADFIADGAEPQWHLDYIKWRWEPGKPSGLPKQLWIEEEERRARGEAEVVSTKSSDMYISSLYFPRVQI